MESLRLLVVHDVDIHSSSLLAEKYVPLTPEYDAVLAIGPFYHAPLDNQNKLEDYAVAEGDIASSIAQLENIVCRVLIHLFIHSFIHSFIQSSNHCLIQLLIHSLIDCFNKLGYLFARRN